MELDYIYVFNKYGDINSYMRTYHEKIMGVERSVGQIMDMLKERKIADNTVVIFLSDHGTHFGEKQLAGKWTPYEPSLRIPLIIYDPRPGASKGRVSDKMVLNIDIAPTLLDLAGVEVPEIMDGRSLVPLMKGENVVWRKEFAFEHFTSPSNIPAPIPRSDGIRTENFKYVRWFDVAPAAEELFDLQKDPGEMTNLVNDPEYAGQLKILRAKYDAWRKANPSTFTYDTYSRRAQSGAKEIDWDKFKKTHPAEYSKIAKQVDALGVTWAQAVNDRQIRIRICKAARYWY